MAERTTDPATGLFPRIDHGKTADEVVHQIELLVLEGILRVGDRLPAERQLSRQFDVSRPILREALKTLENRGLLVSRHGGGTFVDDVIGQVFSKPVMDLIARHRKASHDYLEFRREMEGMTAAFAAQRATSADLALLSKTVEAMKKAHRSNDFARESELDVEFHNAIGECAHNIVLMHTLRSCYRLLSDGVFYNRAMVYTLPGARNALLEQHLAIHQAIMAGDPDAARSASQAHIDFIAQTIRDAERNIDRERISQLRLQQRTSDQTRKTPLYVNSEPEAAQ